MLRLCTDVMSVELQDEPESIEALRALVHALRAERDQSAQRAGQLELQKRQLEHRVERLANQVKRLAYLYYGRRSEKLSVDELRQLAFAFGATDEQATALDPIIPHPEAPTESEDTEQNPTRKRRKHPGRSQLSPELERVVTPVPVPEEQRRCSCCGETMVAFNSVEHERVEYVPEKLVVHVEQREVLGCQTCRGSAQTAPRQAPVATRRAGSSLVAALIESKCDDALPIHRQRDRFRRLGFDVPLNTLYEYFAYGTDLLSPVAKVTLSIVLGQHYVQADDTQLMVLDKQRRQGRYRGHLWCFTGPGPLVAYTFTESWTAQEIAPYLGAIEGFIQCDDYKGYGSQVRLPDGSLQILVPPERRLGCMMHVRRRFYEAHKLGERQAAQPLAHIATLYRVEEEAKLLGLDAGARLALRQAKSLPALRQLETWVGLHKPLLPPKSKLGQAASYAEQQRVFIRRCFSDGHFEIDNGKVERQIREPAIGRRNFLFSGSKNAAKRLAAAYTLVQSCRALGISTRDYLIDVLDKLEASWPLRRVGELVPDRWARDRGLLDSAPTSAS
jgi:transposase